MALKRITSAATPRRKARNGSDTASRIRAARAADLRSRGYTFEQIAIECGYSSRGSAFHAVDRELDRHEELVTHKLRAVMVRQLDALTVTLYEQLERCKIEADRLWIIDRLRLVAADKCKVQGLYPTANDPAVVQGYTTHIFLHHAGEDGTVDELPPSAARALLNAPSE
jgi:hypothetical protein